MPVLCEVQENCSSFLNILPSRDSSLRDRLRAMKSKEKTSYTPSTNTEKRTQEYAITTYELVVLFVGLASSASIALLAVERFTILLVLTFAALGTAVAAFYFGYSVRKNVLRTTPFMGIIVLVGLLLRLEHWPNLTGVKTKASM